MAMAMAMMGAITAARSVVMLINLSIFYNNDSQSDCTRLRNYLDFSC
jgi:hypothetical protein